MNDEKPYNDLRAGTVYHGYPAQWKVEEVK